MSASARRASVRELDARLAAARRIAELETVLRITLAENRKLSATDDLTRVASRRFFSKHFPREMERAARYGRGLSLVLCDIDFFKKLNDTLGHAGGDQILRQFGARLQQNLRRGVDWVARIGGEEFAVVLPETSLRARRWKSRASCARRLPRRPSPAIARAYRSPRASDCADSIACPPASASSRSAILKIADAALYRSKHGGRNRVTATHVRRATP